MFFSIFSAQTTWRRQYGLLVWCFLISPFALAQTGNGSYLDALEGEASDLTLDKQTQADPATGKQQATGSSTSKEQGSGGARELRAGLGRSDFEQSLKTNFIGSYLFYQRLDDAKKAEVFGFYQATPDPAKIREKILELVKQ